MTAVDPGECDPIARQAAVSPDRTAIRWPASDDSVTFEALDRRVETWAVGLRDHRGADPDAQGPRIGVCVEDRADFVAVLGAIWRVGASAVLLDPGAPDRTVQQCLDVSDPAAVVVESPADRDLDTRLIDVAALGDGTPSASVPPTDWAAEREAVVAFTSGTTGRPRGVRLAVRTLAASVGGWADRLGSAAECWLDPLPVHHMGGFMPIVRAIGLGTTAVVERPPDPERIGALLADHSLTGVSLVPTQLSALLDAGWSPPDALSAVLVGGAPVPTALRRHALDRGVPLWPTYGTTETASGVAIATPDDLHDRIDTVGRPLDGVNVTIRDPETGAAVDSGVTGEIVVDGPSVTPGYCDESGEWSAAGLRTGDLGSIEDGFLFVAGRLDDRIVSGGETIDPHAVERVVGEHPAVEAVAVVGIPDDRWGERVGAAVVTDDAALPDSATATLDAYAREHLRAPARPKTWTVVQTIPRTASGTVDRAAIRDLIRDDE
ncbi:class I adenylate-forming enzyme family protein [Halococcoides cellulosivorans]|uniref:2-succinylbenzoate-CoA ligase n=1 Tax=Halococcoides cellulosivorans TaxID=1679096 RepID=A0A2R4X132_9EURY|nr:class I adenylate-forming enzyme family protein [Halococcoides cellulosivorans]AWB27486.1 2-succinylbenzoate-CoA ligase [Halococcoides cellulosivorans]